MRIGLIAPPWIPVPPTAYGGTEGVIDTLARGLQAAGQEVALFTTGDASCPVPRHWRFSRPASPIGTTVAEFCHVQAAYQALSDCDVIHDHTLAGPVWAATRHRCPPVVTTHHGLFTPELRSFYAEIASYAAVLAISHSQAKAAVGVPITRVIHHGLDPNRFPVGRGDGGYAVFLGRMSPDKGAHRAIDIARRANVPVFIAAKMREPAERHYFDRFIRPELGPGVDFLGEIGPAERSELLGGAVALLNPIRWDEPFGLVMIEALACGTPVIAYPYGAAPEIIRNGVTGYLCAGADSAVRALGQVHKLDRKDCRSAIEYFSANRMVAEHIAVYQQLAELRVPNVSKTPLRRRVGTPAFGQAAAGG